jgi:hypothetical protein
MMRRTSGSARGRRSSSRPQACGTLAWAVNQSRAVAPTASTLLRQRGANEHAGVDDVATNHARRYAIVGLQPVDPVGPERLAALAETHARGVRVCAGTRVVQEG